MAMLLFILVFMKNFHNKSDYDILDRIISCKWTRNVIERDDFLWHLPGGPEEFHHNSHWTSQGFESITNIRGVIINERVPIFQAVMSICCTVVWFASLYLVSTHVGNCHVDMCSCRGKGMSVEHCCPQGILKHFIGNLRGSTVRGIGGSVLPRKIFFSWLPWLSYITWRWNTPRTALLTWSCGSRSCILLGDIPGPHFS
jgi:hypothetical protein